MQYEAAYIPGLDIYGIVWVETGLFEKDLYYTDALSTVEQRIRKKVFLHGDYVLFGDSAEREDER